MKSKIVLLTFFCACFFQVATAQDFRFGKVSKEEILETENKIDPTANAAILYREIETSFDYNTADGFYMTTDVFERIKIYNKEGFTWATNEVDRYLSSTGKEDEVKGLKAYTYYLGSNDKVEEVKLQNDGIFEIENNKYVHQTKFTMPDLREGCVIEFKYTIQSPFIGNIEEFRFQETIPVNKVKVKFSAPEYFNFQTHQRGWIPYRIDRNKKERTIDLGRSVNLSVGLTDRGTRSGTTSNGNATFEENIYTIELTDVPPLKVEAFAGNINNYATTIKFELSYTDFPGSTIDTYSTTWEAVSKTTYDSFDDELSRTGYFEDDLATATKGASTPEEKVIAIYNFVKNKMNWNGNGSFYSEEGVKDAYKKGAGNAADINLMLIGMLRKAGLNANPVILSTKAHGIPLFPTRNGFNYVVAAVERPNEVILLDATNKNADMGILNPQLINWQGRLIRKDRSSNWVPLSPNAPATQSTMVNIELKDDFSISGKVQNRSTGHYAWDLREKYKNTNEESARKALEKDKPQTELSEIKFENLNETEQHVSLSYNFEAFDMAEDISGKIYFTPMAFLCEKENPFKLDNRSYPVDFSYARKDRYIINIDVPEGYKVESLPEDAGLTLGERSASFRYAIKQMGNKLQLSVELSLNEAFVSAEEYSNLKKFYQMVVDKENEKVVLVKG